MTMRIALNLPRVEPIEWQLLQRISGIRVRFGSEAIVEVVRMPDALQPIENALGGFSVKEQEDLSLYDLIIVFSEEDRAQMRDLASYSVSAIGRVVPISAKPISNIELPFLEKHPFSALGPAGWGELDYYCFHFFPYGYLHRLVGLGSTDPFGHRIEGDLRQWKERGDTKLIVCLGGSAVWGTSVLPDQCFPARLQHAFDEREKHSDLKVKVLNFGVPGAVLLNAMQRFILFVAELRPEIVILHDGINDFFYATTSDAWLTREHATVYQQNFEAWAKVLHGHEIDKKQANLGGPTGRASGVLPIDVLRAYIRRKREFVTLCQGFGAKVVSGLQPFVRSKKAMSPTEDRRVRAWVGDQNAYQAEFTMISALYELFTKEQPNLGADESINFHRLFANFGSDMTLFNDMVHLGPDGEEIIGNHYAEIVANLFLKGKHNA